ncbi:MAG: DUF5060 domain-containing protein [Lentisphaeria bacterium]|nr:DUF5060 domain-containing protein [Lentisphaeria bacterium]
MSTRVMSTIATSLFCLGSIAMGGDTVNLDSVVVSGELKQWHKVTITFDGPSTSETATLNPFRDYRLNVLFSHASSGKSYTVPGYYAADGNAADTGADSGSKWRAHFAPDERGEWMYTASFRTGVDVAISDDEKGGDSAGFFDGATGAFTVGPTDKTGCDFRARGMLQVVSQHHLRFAGTGEYFLKCGADAPENLFAYEDFDGTPNVGRRRKSWSPHAGDYDASEAAAYTWADGKGTELLGAIRYLAGKGMNAFSFLTFNIDGDDDNVFPHRLAATAAAYEAIADNQRWANGGVHRDRFDVSKLDQWERVFCYADQLGMYLHVKTQETENELRMDGGDLGPERMLYYRELIARFSHHLALNWNLGEEINNASTLQKVAWAVYFRNHDPYRHHIVIHNGSNHYDLLGSASALTGFSLQTHKSDFSHVHSLTLNYINRSVKAGKPWVVACDEPGDASHALRPDDDAGNSHVDGRKNALWGHLMAGGAGLEWYFGYRHANSDLTCQDWRSRDAFWDVCAHALDFFMRHVPFWRMRNHNELIGNAANDITQGFCLASTDRVYVIYLPTGGTKSLDLSSAGGTFSVHWFDPRNGGDLQTGTTEIVSAGAGVTIGLPPHDTGEDWVALVRRMAAQ